MTTQGDSNTSSMSSQSAAISTDIVDDDKWFHVVLSIPAAGDGIMLYLNGNLIVEASQGIDYDSELNATPLNIGFISKSDNPSSSFDKTETRHHMQGMFTQLAVYYDYFGENEAKILYDYGVPFDLVDTTDKRHLGMPKAYWPIGASNWKGLQDKSGSYPLISTRDEGKARTTNDFVEAHEKNIYP